MKIRISLDKNIVVLVIEKIISFPLCQCGCGKEVIKKNNKYIHGHHTRLKDWKERSMMIKLCSCGCGKQLKLLESKFFPGHNIIGLKHSDQWKLENSKRHKGKNISEDHKKAISKKNKGRHHTQETIFKLSQMRPTDLQRAKMSACHKGKKRKPFSDITKEKIRLSKIGKKLSKQHIEKMSRKLRGRKHTEETKKLMSASAKKHREKYGITGAMPNEGSNEKYILDEISLKCELKILRNDRKLTKKIRGKSIDGYIEQYNLPLEVLEPHHYKPSGELSNNDQTRELNFAYDLGCMTYFINEQKFLKNSEEEIHKIKTFLELLDKGVN